MNSVQRFAARFNFPLVDTFTGIVFGGGALYLADLKRSNNGGFRLHYAAEVPLEGRNPFSPEVARLLTRLARENNLRGRTAAILAAGRGLRIRIHEMPRMEHDELVASLRFTEAEVLPYSVDDAELDGFILPGGVEGRMPVLMSALERGEATRYHQSLSLSPFRPIALTVVPAALDALLEHTRVIDTNVPVAFVCISNTSTGIYVFEGGGIRFTRDIGFGGDSFIDALTGEYEVPEDRITVSHGEAQTLAAFFGVPRGNSLGMQGPRGIDGKLVLARIQPVLDRLVTELGRSLDYYRNDFKCDSVSSVYLVGSAARMENLAEYLSDALGCRLTIYNPFDDFVMAEGPPHKIARENGAAYAVAVGVALDKGRRINLLPEKMRWSVGNWLRTRLPAAASVLFIVLMAAFSLAAITYRKNLDIQLAAVERQIAGFKQVHEADVAIEATANDIREEIKRIDARKTAYPELKGRDINWQALYGEVGSLIPNDMALDRLVFTFGGQKEYAADGAIYGRQALLEGHIRDGLDDQVKTLERFLTMVRHSPFFTHATLISARKVEDGGNTYLKFTLGADINRGPQ